MTTTTIGTRATVVYTPGRVLLSTVLLAIAASVLFVFKIGPVVLTLTRSHGIHAGDALALFPAAAAVLLLLRPVRP